MVSFRVKFLACTALALAITASSADAASQFESTVQPILKRHCVGCHSDAVPSPMGGLRLDTYGRLMAGGNAGQPIVPGHPERSPLMHVLSHEDTIKMPPGGKLSDAELSVVSEWIRGGARGPRSASAESGPDRLTSNHWAFQPVRTPTVPASEGGWAAAPIDRFIERRLADKGLEPSPDAARRTLIRRAYFDVVGLPPTPQAVRAFVADDSSEAFPRLVDELLASPQFGARWARYWLDVARYSDEGFQARPFPSAWPYRDWVIDALNADMPYDEFVTHQLAADRLQEDPKHLAALGLLTVGINLPRPTDVPENLDDRIDVVTRGFLGLSVACARCHDHKFDPIPQKDYYSLYGVFLNSPDVMEPIPIDSGGGAPMASYYEGKLRMRRETISRFIDERLEDHKAEFRKPEVVAAYIKAAWEGRNVSDRQLEAASKVKNLNLYLLKRWRDYLQSQEDVGDSLFADAGERSVAIAEKLAAVSRPEPWEEATKERLRAVLWADDAPVNVPREDFWWIQNEGDSNVVKQLKWQYHQVMTDWVFRGGPPHAMTVADARELQPAHVFVRGNQHDKGAPVERRFLSILNGEQFESGSGRLELARAIAAADNPLTARVWVNRVWQHLFGEGLVRTPSNFGITGELPSHPELLDYLAATLVADGWSTKKLIRRILLSRAYRQASAPNGAGVEVDPENRLLWRQNRRRLEFEPLRDAMLAVAGRLDTSVGGAPFELNAQPASPRRAIYAYISREEPSAIMRAFDFSNPEQHTARRQLTTVPQQALFLLNSPFVAEQARFTGAQLEAGSVDERVRELYWNVLGRAPRDGELTRAASFIGQSEPLATEPGTPTAWRYGTAHLDPAAGRVSGFREFTHAVGDRLQHAPIRPAPVGGNASLTAKGGTPGDDLRSVVVRRWIAPAAGRYKITGKVNHAMGAQARRFGYSNGIRAWVVTDRQGVLAQWTLAGSSAVAELGGITLEEGEHVDFVVDARDDYESDTFTWAPMIEQDLTTAERDAGVKPQRWDATSDFRVPAPAPLDSWAQLAQVLLLTNEFAFVD